MGVIVNLKADTGLVDRSENTVRFYKDVATYPTLTREEEIKWFNKLKHGNSEEKEIARNFIWLCNQRLAIAVAKKWSTTDTLMDYTNEANFGLNEAIDSFNVDKGVKFCSYAMWYIKRAINRYNNNSLYIVKKTNYSKTFHVIAKATNDFLQENERMPTLEELKNIVNTKYNKDVKDEKDLLDLRVSYVDESNGDDYENPNYGDMADYNRASASYNDYVSKSENDFNKELITSLLNKLSPRKQIIIKMRFGLYEEDNGIKREYELNEIAEKLNLTSERIRQLENEAMKELKMEYKQKIGKLI